jgi:hypothetical protein
MLRHPPRPSQPLLIVAPGERGPGTKEPPNNGGGTIARKDGYMISVAKGSRRRGPLAAIIFRESFALVWSWA